MTAPLEPRPSSPTRPKVVKWFRVYAGALAFVYFALVVILVLTWIFAWPEGIPESDLKGAPLWLFRAYWIFLVVLCLVLGGAFLTPFFLERKPWVWIYDMVLICIGFTSACCLPAAIPLFIYWLKPEAKAYFGRG